MRLDYGVNVFRTMRNARLPDSYREKDKKASTEYFKETLVKVVGGTGKIPEVPDVYYGDNLDDRNRFVLVAALATVITGVEGLFNEEEYVHLLSGDPKDLEAFMPHPFRPVFKWVVAAARKARCLAMQGCLLETVARFLDDSCFLNLTSLIPRGMNAEYFGQRAALCGGCSHEEHTRNHLRHLSPLPRAWLQQNHRRHSRSIGYECIGCRYQPGKHQRPHQPMQPRRRTGQPGNVDETYVRPG